MNILVCIKQVVDSNAVLRVDAESKRVHMDGPQKYWMNPPDECAVEEALRIKGAQTGAKVDVVTVGPDRAAQVLDRAIGMGADTGVHICVGEGLPLGPLTIASWIAGYAGNRPYDLIFTGVMSEDDMQGQVGPLLAECLGFPCATSVILETIRPSGAAVYVEREIENGQRDMVELDLPAVLTIQTGINQPRYPTLSNLMRARKQKPVIIDSGTLSPVVERERILNVRHPSASRRGIVLEGDGREKAALLLQLLKRKGLIRTGV